MFLPILSIIEGISDFYLTIILWGILILTSIVVELITDEVTIIWGTVGAIFALISALFKVHVLIQIVVFFVFTIAFILIFRPIVMKARKNEVIRTNADRLIGMVAVILEPFKDSEVGKVTVNGQTWRAISTSNEEFFEGEKVQVEGLSGTKVIVSKINNEKIIRL